MKKLLGLVLASALFLVGLAGCSSTSTSTTEDVAMKYMTVEELAEIIGTEGYKILDVRKEADFAEAHIPGAMGADMDAARNGDEEAGLTTMKSATDGVEDVLVLICYSGNTYAKASTNALTKLGYDMDKVFTLEGGMAKWTEIYPEIIEN